MVCLLVANPTCSSLQSAAERNKLIDEAERSEFTLRRTEFVGLTYTRDHVLRDRMRQTRDQPSPHERGEAGNLSVTSDECGNPTR